MSIGVPIIAYIDGISKKIIRQAQCGIVNTPNDYKGLAKSILKLKKMNKTQIRRYKKNAMNYSNKHFNLIKISNKLQEVLDFDVQK
jgi:glycosyltransferase involved in cell wall biosynthesis